jgi:hypothetical protein
MSNETCDAVCDSHKSHPALQVLHMSLSIQPRGVLLKSRIQALVDMPKVNTLIHTINLEPCHREQELYRRSVIPYLETNQLRPRLRAIQKSRPIVYRAKVPGRALPAARTDANSIWMVLSGNLEVAFPSTTATTTPALASLRCCRYFFTNNVATAATSNAAAVDATVAATRVASAASTSAVANVTAAPTACQRRKACP